jgi:hypothetical protein
VIVVMIMAGLIKLISLLIREDREAFQRPIFLMGKGFGALLALLIAAQPPQRDDLALIIVDPGRYIYAPKSQPSIQLFIISQVPRPSLHKFLLLC